MKIADKWMELENILNEATQTQKDTQGMYSAEGPQEEQQIAFDLDKLMSSWNVVHQQPQPQ